MLKNKNHIRVRVRFPAAKKEYECGLAPQGTLKENILLLYRLVQDEISSSWQMPQEFLVFDSLLNHEYNPNVTVVSNGISDGTILLIL